MINDVMKTLGVINTRTSTKKRKFKYKLVKRGVVISKHYTKRAGLSAKKRGETLMPIRAKTRKRLTRKPVRRKRRAMRSKTRRY